MNMLQPFYQFRSAPFLLAIASILFACQTEPSQQTNAPSDSTLHEAALPAVADTNPYRTNCTTAQLYAGGLKGIRASPEMMDDQGIIYFFERNNDRPQKYGISRLFPDGSLDRYWIPIDIYDGSPRTFTMDRQGNFYLAYSQDVYRVSPEGEVTKIYEQKHRFFATPHFAFEQGFFVVNYRLRETWPNITCRNEEHNITTVDFEGNILAEYACVGKVRDIAVGQDSTLYILNNYDQPNTIIRITPDGTVDKEWVSRDVTGRNLVIDSKGNLYTSPGRISGFRMQSRRLIKIDPEGNVTTYEGNIGGGSSSQEIYIDPHDRIYIRNTPYLVGFNQNWRREWLIVPMQLPDSPADAQPHDYELKGFFFTENEFKVFVTERLDWEAERTLLMRCTVSGDSLDTGSVSVKVDSSGIGSR